MLIDAYLNRLKLGGYRPSTITTRRTCLLSFQQFISPTRIQDAGRIEVEAYLSRDLSPESRRAYRGHLRSFYSWAVEEEYVAKDPTAKLPPIRVPRAVPRPIKDDDLILALEQADVRMRAWLLLMALGGLRCIEVAGLRPQDLTVNDEGALLYLRECKGGGAAQMPAHSAVVAALQRLPVRNGEWWTCTPRHVSTTVNAFLRSQGIASTAHQLRHWAGTVWYRQSGHDLLATAALLRHVNVQTTQVYAQSDPTRPAEIVSLVSLHEPVDVAAAAREQTRAKARQIRSEARGLRRIG